MKLSLLILDDNLESVGPRLRGALDRLGNGARIPQLTGGVADPFKFTTSAGNVVEVHVASNQEPEDPDLVAAELPELCCGRTFDLVLVDDAWVERPVAGQEVLVGAVLDHVQGEYPNLPIVALFTAHWNRPERAEHFGRRLDGFGEAIMRITALDKADTSGLVLLLERVMAEKRLAHALALEKRRAERAQARLTALGEGGLPEEDQFEGMIGASEPMRHVYWMIRRVAKFNVPVLIEGETGSGKELVAAAIHRQSGRTGSFVPVVVSMWEPSEVAGELFGVGRNRFPGVNESTGYVGEAHLGTLFLDEIGHLHRDHQSLLLRFLNSGIDDNVYKYNRRGENNIRTTNARLIFASNVSVDQLVEKGQFLSDLRGRFGSFKITMPSLRERVEDLDLLVPALIQRLAKKHNLSLVVPDETAMTALKSFPWPLNVRQLRGVLEKCLILAEGRRSNFSRLLIETLDSEPREIPGTQSVHPDGRVYARVPDTELRSGARKYLDKYEDAAARVTGAMLTQGDLASALGVRHTAIVGICKQYGAAMLAFLDTFPEAWPNLGQRTGIRGWCERK